MPFKDPERAKEYDRLRAGKWRKANPEKAREAGRRCDLKRRGKRTLYHKALSLRIR